MKRDYVIGVIVLALVALGGLYYVIDRSIPVASESTMHASYHNAQYHFGLQYPDDLVVRVTDEGGGASTLTFETSVGVRVFEIFIVTYAESSVSDARFRLDEPSGVRTNVVATTVGDVPASAFNGMNFSLGETYETWFIHGGFLYEVATTKPLGTWLQGVLSTFSFDH